MIRKPVSGGWYPVAIVFFGAGAAAGCAYSAALVLAGLILPALVYIAGQLYSLYLSQNIEGGVA
mgnify:FL=1